MSNTMSDTPTHEPSKYRPNEPTRQGGSAAKRARAENRARIAGLAHKMLGGIEHVIDALAARAKATAVPAAPVDILRRQLVNTLQLSRACANRRCRRSHRCLGEPLHCLQAAIPILPADAFDGILRKQPARRRKRPQAGISAPR